LVPALTLAASLSVTATLTDMPDVPYENIDYNGRFTFVRLKFDPLYWGFGPYAWGLDLKWNHDYPRAEHHLARILSEFTAIDLNAHESNILSVNDPRLFQYPWLYFCEPGYWRPTDEEARTLREYLLKGGFLVIDDFVMRDWYNFVEMIHKVLPDGELVRLDVSEPIFNLFFHMESLDFSHPFAPELIGEYYGIYEDNDRNGRLMVLVNYNMDIGDYWEWSDTAWVPIDLSNEAYKLGVNYVLYGMTH
jgi:hypothetical protein